MLRHVVGAQWAATALDVDDGTNLVGALAHNVETVGARLRMHHHDRRTDPVEQRGEAFHGVGALSLERYFRTRQALREILIDRLGCLCALAVVQADVATGPRRRFGRLLFGDRNLGLGDDGRPTLPVFGDQLRHLIGRAAENIGLQRLDAAELRQWSSACRC